MAKKEDKPKRNPKVVMTLCILVGTGIGFMIGAAFFNMGAGILIGLCVGIAAGFSLTSKEPSE